MSKTEFTPGPWIVDHHTKDVPEDGGLPCAIYAEDDNLIAGFEDTHLHMLKAEHAKQSHANAHLIAAAPELYEVVEAFVAEWDKGTAENKTKISDMFKHVLAGREALAKARGEATP